MSSTYHRLSNFWRLQMKKIEFFEGSNEHTSDTLIELGRRNFPVQTFGV